MNSSNILDTIRNGDWKDSDIAAKKDNHSKEVMSEDDKLDNRYIIFSAHSIASIEAVSFV